jgi:hypothetical protein
MMPGGVWVGWRMRRIIRFGKWAASCEIRDKRLAEDYDNSVFVPVHGKNSWF